MRSARGGAQRCILTVFNAGFRIAAPGKRLRKEKCGRGKWREERCWVWHWETRSAMDREQAERKKRSNEKGRKEMLAVIWGDLKRRG